MKSAYKSISASLQMKAIVVRTVIPVTIQPGYSNWSGIINKLYVEFNLTYEAGRASFSCSVTESKPIGSR